VRLHYFPSIAQSLTVWKFNSILGPRPQPRFIEHKPRQSGESEMTENSHSEIPHPWERHPDDASGHQGDHDGDSQAEGSHQETPDSEGPAHTDVAAKEANGIRTIEEEEDRERQQRDAGLRQEIYKCQEQIHALNADQDILLVENDRLRNERNECRDKLDRIQSKLLQDFCFKKYPEEEQRMGPRPRGKYVAMDRIIDEILQDLADRDRRNLELVTETSRLEHNLETLQKSLLSNVERFRPTQDDELISNFESLASVIKVITRDVPSSVDCNKLAMEFANYTLIDGVSVSYWKDRLHRKCLLEAAIWSILMDTIFSTPFYVFGEYANLFTTEWKKLFMSKSAF
jgi:regulator of replication initiation timing